MSSLKFLWIGVVGVVALLFTQCKSAAETSNQDTVLTSPAFANEAIYYNTFSAGTEKGGTGYEIHFENFTLPNTVTLQQLFFADHSGQVYATTNGYGARLHKMETENVVMASNAVRESVNEPPANTVKFPFSIPANQVGVVYMENEVRKYALMSNVLQREPIFYPSAPPKQQEN